MDPGPALIASAPTPARDSVLLSISFLVTGLAGAGVALLLTLIAGSGARTDAVLAAYSLYAVATLYAATARSALVPMMGAATGERDFRLRATEVAARTDLAGMAIATAIAVLAPVAGPLLTHALPPRAQLTAVFALLVLAPATYLQMRAAALSAVLSAASRFRFFALAYGGAGLCSVAVTPPLVLLLGPLGATVGILLGSLVLSVSQTRFLARFGVRIRGRPRWIRERRQWALMGSLGTVAAVGLALQAQLAVALANLAPRAGEITVYSYAYFLVLLFVTVTSASLSAVTLPGLVEQVAHNGRPAVQAFFARVGVLVLSVVLPLLAATAAFGEPLLRAVFAGSVAPPQIHLLYELVLAFTPLCLAYALVYLLIPVALAVGAQRRLPAIALAATALQAVLVALVRGDTVSVGIVHSAVAVLTCGALVRIVLGPGSLTVLARLLWRSLPAVLLATPFLAGWALGGGHASVVVAVAGAAAGLALYAVAGAALWPAVLGSLPLVSALTPGRRRPGRRAP